MPSNQNLKKQLEEEKRKYEELNRLYQEEKQKVNEERMRASKMIEAGYGLLSEIRNASNEYKTKLNKKKEFFENIRSYTKTKTSSGRYKLRKCGYKDIKYKYNQRVYSGIKVVNPLNVQKRQLKNVKPRYYGEIAKRIKTHPFHQQEINTRDDTIETLKSQNLKLEEAKQMIKRVVSSLSSVARPDSVCIGRMDEIRASVVELENILRI